MFSNKTVSDGCTFFFLRFRVPTLRKKELDSRIRLLGLSGLGQQASSEIYRETPLVEQPGKPHTCPSATRGHTYAKENSGHSSVHEKKGGLVGVVMRSPGAMMVTASAGGQEELGTRHELCVGPSQPWRAPLLSPS